MTTKKVSIFLALLLTAVQPLYAGTSYGEAASDWTVFDDNPTGASIKSADEPLLGKTVVQTSGAGKSNSYLTGGISEDTGWNNTDEFLLSWRMQSTEFTNVFVRVDTIFGWRFLHYNALSVNKLLNADGRYIHHGLGTNFRDGQWNSWSRDLQADLTAAEPDNQLLAVNGLIVRGNALIDGIQLDAINVAPFAAIDGGERTVKPQTSVLLNSQNSYDSDGAIYSYVWRDEQGNTISEDTTWQGSLTDNGMHRFSLEVTDNEDLSAVATTSITVADTTAPTVYFNGDGGTLEGWRLSDVTPPGAAFENVVDPTDNQNRVIKLASTGTENSFILGSLNPKTSWNNKSQTNFTWRSRSVNNFRLYVRVTTVDGWRFIWYDTRNESTLANKKGSYIHHGLGNGVRDGEWQTFSRDLQADLELAQPGNKVLAVHGVVVRGSVMLDDIALYSAVDSDEPKLPDVPVLAAPTIMTPENNALFEAGASIAMQWQADDNALNYDFSAINTSANAVIDSGTFDVATVCAQGTCSLSKSYELNAADSYQLRLRAANSAGSSDWSTRNFGVSEPVIEPPVEPPVEPPAPPVTPAVPPVLPLAEPQEPPVDEPAAPPSLPPVNEEPELPKLPSGPLPRASDDLPSTPMLSQPADNEVFELNSNIAMKWLADVTAKSYDFGLYDPRTEATTYTSGIIPSDICTDTACTWNHLLDVPVGDGYKLRLRAGNDQGNSSWVERSFSVGEEQPKINASFTVSAMSGPAPLTLTVDASQSSDPVGITNYQWDFGGQETLEGSDLITASHVFQTPGVYSIILTVSNAEAMTDSEMIIITVEEPAGQPTEQQAARLLAQASFGATDAAIAEVQRLGIEGWIDNQLTLNSPPHLDYVMANSNGSMRDARHEIFWLSVVDGEDQLRSRVAFALSQFFVVSDLSPTLSQTQYGVTNYYDMMRNNAFGNYRELLEQVTLNPVMGVFLSMLQNDKGSEETNTRADENYAREVLQLFSIGLNNLNQDGTLAEGKTFTQEHVEDFARVFTGWNFRGADRWNKRIVTDTDLNSEMEAWEDHHDTGAKTLLGGEVVPAGLSPREDIERALDNIFAHQNVAPFFSRHLITQLVTSNPSPAYIGRVAAVFNNNGQGVRGDIQATVKAVLMDQEARNFDPNNVNYGKLREPVLRLSHLWRAFSITQGSRSERGEYNTYSPQLRDLNGQTGQAVLRSPSVFNFFLPDYAPNGPIRDAGLIGPEFQIFTDGNILATASRFNNQVHRHFKQNDRADEKQPSYLDFEKELAIADDSQALLDRLNLLLMSGSMSADLNNLLLTHLESLPTDDAGKVRRVQDALSLIISSPEYLVQR